MGKIIDIEKHNHSELKTLELDIHNTHHLILIWISTVDAFDFCRIRFIFLFLISLLNSDQWEFFHWMARKISNFPASVLLFFWTWGFSGYKQTKIELIFKLIKSIDLKIHNLKVFNFGFIYNFFSFKVANAIIFLASNLSSFTTGIFIKYIHCAFTSRYSALK